MTLEEIKAIVRAPGCYCLTSIHDGKQISQRVMIWAIWDTGECRQGKGVPREPILATQKGWILLHEVISLTACPERSVQEHYVGSALGKVSGIGQDINLSAK